MKRGYAVFGWFALLAPVLAAAEALKVNGSTTVNLPVAEAAEILRAEKKMGIRVDTQGGSSGGISMLGDGQVQIGMASKPVSADDRAKYPNVNIKETHIGEDAVVRFGKDPAEFAKLKEGQKIVVPQ